METRQIGIRNKGGTAFYKTDKTGNEAVREAAEKYIATVIQYLVSDGAEAETIEVQDYSNKGLEDFKRVKVLVTFDTLFNIPRE